MLYGIIIGVLIANLFSFILTILYDLNVIEEDTHIILTGCVFVIPILIFKKIFKKIKRIIKGNKND